MSCFIVDSVTRFAHAIREVGVGLRRAADRARLSGVRLHRAAPPARTRRAGRRRMRAPITAIISILVDGDNHNDPIADSTRGILDGHILCWSAASPRRGRYPPINPLASISRLARKAWTPDQEKLVSRLKALIHQLRGDARPAPHRRLSPRAAIPDLDMAIKQVPVIYEVLKQTPGERPSRPIRFCRPRNMALKQRGRAGRCKLRARGEGMTVADFDADGDGFEPMQPAAEAGATARAIKDPRWRTACCCARREPRPSFPGTSFSIRGQVRGIRRSGSFEQYARPPRRRRPSAR
jgi:flagellum-specific ATP synthase